MRSQLKDMLYAIPAVLMLIGVAVILIQQATADDGKLAARYQAQARRAFGEKDFQWALRCYQKAEDLGQPTPQLIYEKAICLQSLGRHEEAVNVMRQVKKLDSEFHPARLWLVNDLFTKKEVTPEELADAERELDDIIAQEPNSVMAHRLAVPIKTRRGGLSAALEHLRRLASMSEGDRLRLAAAYSATDDRVNAVKQAQRVREDVQRKLRDDAMNTEMRLLGVQACVIMRDFRAALELLSDGLKAQGQDRRLMRALSTTYLAWAEYARQQDAKPEQILDLLLLATKVPPADPRAYQRLAAFAVSDKEHRDEVKQALIAALARGKSTAVLHMLLGDLYYREGDQKQANRYWEVALELEPNSVVAMNNLAWGLAWQDPPELDAALRLIEKAISKAPDRAQLLDTRGQILFKLGRFDAARVDLERALKEMPDDWRLLAVLSQVYEQEGQLEAAAAFRARAKEARDKAVNEAGGLPGQPGKDPADNDNPEAAGQP